MCCPSVLKVKFQNSEIWHRKDQILPHMKHMSSEHMKVVRHMQHMSSEHMKVVRSISLRRPPLAPGIKIVTSVISLSLLLLFYFYRYYQYYKQPYCWYKYWYYCSIYYFYYNLCTSYMLLLLLLRHVVQSHQFITCSQAML